MRAGRRAQEVGTRSAHSRRQLSPTSVHAKGAGTACMPRKLLPCGVALVHGEVATCASWGLAACCATRSTHERPSPYTAVSAYLRTTRLATYTAFAPYLL